MMSALGLLALLPLGFWLALCLDRPRVWPADLYLEHRPRYRADDTVVALVPARNEAAVLTRTLPTLLAQTETGHRVVLIDDGSRDGTADHARELARRYQAQNRLEVISAKAKPAGWSGKVHALSCGFSHLEQSADHRLPEWLLLSDADIAHRPGSVRDLLAQATCENGPYDLVSVMARLEAKTGWERLLIPPFVFFFQLLYPFRRVGRRGSRVSAAAGGCLLVRTRTLQAAGGFDAIAGEVIDDVGLARQIRRVGGHLWLGFDPEIRSVRPYQDLQEIWRMVSRTAFAQLKLSSSLLLVTLAALLVFVVSPPFVVIAAAARAFEGASTWPAAAMAAGAWGLEALALAPAVRHHRVPRAYAWTLPISGFFYALMTASSAWRHWRGDGPAWKGRRFDL